MIFSVYATRRERRLAREGLQVELGRPGASHESLGRLVELNPVHTIAVLAQVEVARGAGDDAQAEQLLWRLAKAAPGMHAPFLMLSGLLWAKDEGLAEGLFRLAAEKAELTGSMEQLLELMKDSRWPLGGKFEGRMRGFLDELEQKEANEAPEARRTLRPFRLIQRLLEEAPAGMEADLVAAIQAEDEGMAEYLAGVLNHAQSADYLEVEVSAAPAALALLVETAGMASLPIVLDLGDHRDARISAASAWAGARLGNRRLKELRAALDKELDALAEDSPVAGIMQQIYIHRREDGFVELMRKALNAPRGLQKWQRDLMMAITTGAMLALDRDHYSRELREALRVNKKRMSHGVAANCSDLLSGDISMRPTWADEEMLGLSLEEICRDAALEDYELPVEAEDEDEADPEEARDWESGLRAELLAWAARKLPEEYRVAAEREFFGEEKLGADATADDQFLRWLLYDYQCPALKGSVAWDYLAGHPGLKEREKSAILQWSSSRAILAEVEKVGKGVGVHLRDLLAGERLFVNDVSSSKHLVQWDCILSRIEKAGERIHFTGNGLALPRTTIRPVVEDLRREFEVSGLDRESYYRQQYPAMRRRLLQALADFRNHLDLRTAEGDALTLARAEYEVEDAERASEALSRLPDFERDETGFAWLEAGGKEQQRLLGQVRFSGKRMKLECMSRERLQRGRSLVEGALGGSARHLGDKFEDPRQAALKGKPAKESRVPPELEKKVVLEALEKHYAGWPDVALPALRGMTPREAVRTEAGRAAVEELLRDFENQSERGRREGRAAYDFSKLRKALGLPRKK